MQHFLKILTLLIIGCLMFSCTGINAVPSADETEMPVFLDLGNGIRAPKAAVPYPELTEANRLRGALTPLRTCYDVTHYDLAVKISIPDSSISGTVVITSVAVNDLTELQIDLASDLIIDSILHNGELLKYSRRYNAVFITFPLIHADTAFDFSIHYHGKPKPAQDAPWDGGFVWAVDKLQRPWVGVACEGDGASIWWPNKDHPSDEPDSMDIHITTPDTLMNVSNGKFVGMEESTDHTRTWHWHVSYPINNYNVTLNVGCYQLAADTLINTAGVQTLNHYVLDYNVETAREYFKQAREILHVYEYYFGEYPFWRDGYKLVETPYSGMEHQTCIAYGTDFRIETGDNHYNTYGLVDYIILHETAHEWWGNSLSADDGAEIWLHEAFATYAEALYIEYKLGYTLACDYLQRRKWQISNAQPVVGPRGRNFWAFDDAYFKGAWILHTLRSVLDDDTLFFNILKGFAQTYRDQVISTSDFVEYVNLMTGEDYVWFFRQYLYNRLPPTMVLEQTADTLRYRWTNCYPDFNMPVDLLVNKKEIRVVPGVEFDYLRVIDNVFVETRTDKFWYGLLFERF